MTSALWIYHPSWLLTAESRRLRLHALVLRRGRSTEQCDVRRKKEHKMFNKISPPISLGFHASLCCAILLALLLDWFSEWGSSMGRIKCFRVQLEWNGGLATESLPSIDSTFLQLLPWLVLYTWTSCLGPLMLFIFAGIHWKWLMPLLCIISVYVPIPGTKESDSVNTVCRDCGS